MLVLECGVDPGYALDRMEPYEIGALARYRHYRHRNGWEQARLVAYVLAQIHSKTKLRPTDIAEFYWEKEVPASSQKSPLKPADTEEARRSLMDRTKAMESVLNTKH